MDLKLDVTNLLIETDFQTLFEKNEDRLQDAFNQLTEKTGEGREFTGWVERPAKPDTEELERIRRVAQSIRKKADVLVVIGIGGSYLGTRAVVEALQPEVKPEGLEILYAGNHLSSTALVSILEYIENKEVCLNVISKSGTTTEPAIAFRFLKAFMERKYGLEESAERIYVTTDREKGALKNLATQMKYETFVVPGDIGGRYSVMTAVGLLPIACAGYDIDAFLSGAVAAMNEYTLFDYNNNALRYALARNVLYETGRKVEILVNYEPRLYVLGEWWKQLYGESEGKNHKGIFPASANFTTDLHSLGQIIQDGERSLFETVIAIEHPTKDITLMQSEHDEDGLNYLAGKSVHYINNRAMEGTLKAHLDGNVPNIRITLDELNEYNLGKLIYFFMISCGYSGYLLGVNPFDQPGVEEYKRNMFKLLGKPGIS